MPTNENCVPTLTDARRPGEIVVGVDDGPAAAAAVRWAADQSRLTGLPLCVVHAWQLGPLESAALTSGAGVASGAAEAAGADARARATQWVRDALGSPWDRVLWRLRLPQGASGPALVAESRGAHLLVIGTQEHPQACAGRFLLVSHYCLSHALAACFGRRDPGLLTRARRSAREPRRARYCRTVVLTGTQMSSRGRIDQTVADSLTVGK